VSQPFNRGAIVPAPRALDERLDEWWVENAWEIPGGGYNLSCYERNRCYLNVGGADFHDVSVLTVTDSKGDVRSVIACDLTGDGAQDLLVRQVGGGPLLLFENRFPRAGYLVVTLRGTKSNTQGIGARLTARVGEETLVREVFPANGFLCQGPVDVHLGLGTAKQVARLTVRWPSGLTQTFEDVAGDRHIVLTEGEPGIGER
jgi:hypothetical protein